MKKNKKIRVSEKSIKDLLRKLRRGSKPPLRVPDIEISENSQELIKINL